MGLLYSNAQKKHLAKGNALFFSPEAVALRNDPELGDIQELALLDHFLQGDKNLAPRYGEKESVILDTNSNIVREGPNELSGYDLVPDDAVEIDPIAAKRFEIEETIRYMHEGEQRDAFRALDDDQRLYIRSLIEKHIAGKAIDSVGESGTKKRKFPKNYKTVELRGKPIPAVFEPGQKRERGIQLILDKIEGIDRDTGVGTYGSPSDAAHREAAATNPALLTAIENIRNGNSSINQSVKAFEGEELKNALDTRHARLLREHFNMSRKEAKERAKARKNKK